MRNLLNMILGAISGFLVVIIILGLVWFFTTPEFGGKHTAQDIERYKTSGHFEEGIFVNLVPTSMDMDMKSMPAVMWDLIRGGKDRQPNFDIPVLHPDSTTIASNESRTKVMWFGHSAFLLQMNGKNILLDPMLGVSPAPHPTLGGKRYARTLPIEIEKLPKIDAVIFSHDHYDHLDYGSVMKLKSKTNHFYVPIGVGAHLRAWGIEESKISELNWWDETELEDIKLAFTPSRHFSGRGLSDRSKTLWGSWVLKGKHNIYFSGDGGYAKHFKEIGEKFGPFDFAMMECGQYNQKWGQIHMMPEETAQASVDVKAKQMMPIHWGAFTLALHDWTDPVVRVKAKAEELNIPVVTPVIGKYFELEDAPNISEEWWVEK